MALLIPEHMTVQGENPYPKYISCIDQCDPLGTQGRKDHLGGAYPDIEPEWPIMALLIPEHMTVQGKTPTQNIFLVLTNVTLWGHLVVKNILGEHTQKSSRKGRLWHS